MARRDGGVGASLMKLIQGRVDDWWRGRGWLLKMVGGGGSTIGDLEGSAVNMVVGVHALGTWSVERFTCS